MFLFRHIYVFIEKVMSWVGKTISYFSDISVLSPKNLVIAAYFLSVQYPTAWTRGLILINMCIFWLYLGTFFYLFGNSKKYDITNSQNQLLRFWFNFARVASKHPNKKWLIIKTKNKLRSPNLIFLMSQISFIFCYLWRLLTPPPQNVPNCR